jgi:outer membrane protein assembly factor BamB
MISTLRSTIGALIAMLGLFMSAAECLPANARPWLPVNTQDAVSYQIDVGHSGGIRFNTGFAMPLTKAWSVNLGNQYISYPVIAGGKVFVNGASTHDTYALDIATGATVWSTNSEAYVFGPAYDNGLVFTAGGQNMYALSAQTGATKWKKSVPFGDFIAVNGQVFAVDTPDGYITAISETDGQSQWSQTVESGMIPAYGAGGVFNASPCQYAKFDAASGGRVWSYDGGCYGVDYITPVYYHKRVYIADIDLENSIWKSRNGQNLGTFTSGAYPPALYVISHETLAFSICCQYPDGTLYAWDAAAHNNIWQVSCSGCTVAPIVVNGHVIIGDDGGNVYALAGKTGKLEWTSNVGGAVRQLSAGDGVLIVISDSGTVTAFVPS